MSAAGNSGSPGSSDTPERAAVMRALASLRGLAVGDALGSRFFVPDNYVLLQQRELPPGPWQWTDDTEMACSILAVLREHGRIDQDALATAFAEHHDVDRGYGRAVDRMLRQIRREGADWRELAAALFDGAGSWGNGAAMRVAPLGAWYADDPARAAEQAELSAYVTHQHREAVAGARAVAAAAALVAQHAEAVERDTAGPPLSGATLLAQVLDLVPRSAVQAGVRRAGDMLDYADVGTVAAVLGCGRRTSAPDTVPFALWAAARHAGDFTEAFWATAQAGGDVDTTCAIVGGIVASGSTASDTTAQDGRAAATDSTGHGITTSTGTPHARAPHGDTANDGTASAAEARDPVARDGGQAYGPSCAPPEEWVRHTESLPGWALP